MTTRWPYIVVVMLCSLLSGFVKPAPAIAETYRDIGPLDTLSDIKARLPTATFTKMQPAWAQPSDVLYRISGPGLSGSIIVKFYDTQPSFKASAEKEADEFLKKSYLDLANEPDDSVTVEWVRWVPLSPIPLTRFVSKYGPPEKNGFSNEDLQPYRHWTKRGLTAFLSDDEKSVVRVDFEFTNAEHRAAYMKKFKIVPKWLEETPAETKADPRGPKGAK